MRRLALLALTTALMAQPLPDAASTVNPPKAPVCGPKWLGGCWNGRNIGTWHETFASRKWQIGTIAFVGSTAYDYAMTAIYVNEPCIEHNENLGHNPTTGDFARDFAETHLPVLVVGTLIHKVTVHNRWASWIYPGMMAYGTGVHIHGGTSWLTCH